MLLPLRRYPYGYTILFIPYYSSAYTGNHWAVYNEGGQFWGYDDGDVTNGDYDYDDSDSLPFGCQLSTPQAASTEGVLNLANASTPVLAPALAPALASAAAPAPAPGSANRSATVARPRQLLCKPLPTAQAEEQESWAKAYSGVIWGICVSVMVIAMIVGILWYEDVLCCKRKPKPQTLAGRVH